MIEKRKGGGEWPVSHMHGEDWEQQKQHGRGREWSNPQAREEGKTEFIKAEFMKAGEGNPQAREEEGKTEFIKHGAQLISGWNSQNMWIRIPWESHCFHLPLPA